VVIESTVTPGSTNGILRDAVARTKGDFRFHMAFSPERVNPGPAYDFYEARNNVKLIGCDDGCHEELQSLYLSIYSDVLLINVEEAELVKTFENAQRDLNIAMMNELSLQCYRKNLNLAHVVDGLRTKRTSPEFYPGMVGGHCIAVDPYFLAEYYETENCLSVYARRINEGYIRKLAGIAIDCNTARGPILIVGQSYKAGVVDKRNSGALKLLTYLQGLGVEVYLHDMLVHDSYDGPSPTLVIGAVNHDTDVDIHRVYRCGPLTNLLTVGLQFTATQCEPFHKVFQL
jgi:UDP-N-acetyl-D-galactosamine dehydrogenase